MKSPGRKLIAFFLISLIGFYTSGFYLVFELNRFIVKREMSAKISANRKLLVEKLVITGHPSDLRHIGKKEIEFKGKMYDVLYRKTTGNSTVYYCLRDIREDVLNRGLKALMKDKVKNLLIPVFSSIALMPSADQVPLFTEQYFCYSPFTENLISALLKVPESPPKVC